MKRVLSMFAITVFILLSSCEKSEDNDNNNNGTPGPTGPPANEVWIQGMQFTPLTITISAGTTIKWTNKDGVAHTVTSDDGVFESGSMNTNSTFSHTFPAAGTFKYHCTPHPVMKATVIVR